LIWELRSMTDTRQARVVDHGRLEQGDEMSERRMTMDRGSSGRVEVASGKSFEPLKDPLTCTAAERCVDTLRSRVERDC